MAGPSLVRGEAVQYHGEIAAVKAALRPRLPHDRAVRLFKLRQAEKIKSEGEAVAEPANGRGKAGPDLLGEVDDRVAQRRHQLGSRSFADPAGILPQSHVAPVMRA